MEKIQLETLQWHTLIHIDDIEPINDDDFSLLHEIGDVLRKHGRTNRFGVCLLHKHFDIHENEMLFEVTDDEKRISTIKVEAKSAIDTPTIETMWRFSDGVNEVTKCVLGCSYSGGHKRVHEKRGM